MDTRLRALAGRQDGVFSVREAMRLGVGDDELRRVVRAGELMRVRRGAYVLGSSWVAATTEGRYRLRCMAVARTRPDDALSHHAALALHGLPLWDHDPERIDLIGDTRQAVNRGGVWLHPGSGAAVLEVAGLRVVTVARAVVRTALTMGNAAAVVAGDAALHAHRVTIDELLAEVARLSPHQGRQRALEAVLRMDPDAESVGESRTRMILQDQGLAYESQVVLKAPDGSFVARVDFVVEGVVVEFDGRLKYQRQRDDRDEKAAGQRAADVVWLEKRREDRIRRLGHPVERVVWADLDRPGPLGARIRGSRPNAPGYRQHPGFRTG
jgi:hypothetical protein